MVQDGEDTGWQVGTVVMVLDSDADEAGAAMLKCVEGKGWQRCGAATMQDENEAGDDRIGWKGCKATTARGSDGAGR